MAYPNNTNCNIGHADPIMRKGQTVAPHLDELLVHDGPEPWKIERIPVHEKLSLAVSMRLMNTSSKPASIFVHR